MADRIISVGGEGEIVEKKSRFIATIRPVHSEEEALAFIQEMKKKYWDARHNCSAYIIGKEQSLSRCSDDGEPSQTAGRPMLDVLEGRGLYDVAVVVTRYFGGVLLGTGGLVRAYQGAVQAGLEECIIKEAKEGYKLRLTVDYTSYGQMEYIMREEALFIENSEFLDKVKMTVLVPVEKREVLAEKITEATSGLGDMEWGDLTVYFE